MNWTVKAQNTRRTLRIYLESAIILTPTSELRNKMTELNILLLAKEQNERQETASQEGSELAPARYR